MKRRTLVRLLVGLGIGIPILVEAITFLGLVEHQLSGGDGTGGPATEAPRQVGIGDELLPETAPTETLSEAVVDASSERWLLRLVVAVDNSTDTAYEFQLGNVTTNAGTVVTGGASTGVLSPSERTTLAGTWTIPGGETPESVDATGILDPDGAAETTTERVRLAKVPVRGA